MASGEHVTFPAPLSTAQPTARPALAPWQRPLLALLVVLLLLGPLVLASSYRLFQFTLAVDYAIAILGLNVVTGYNGQISLGHGAFYAIGAYVTAILMANYDWACWATLPVSAAVAGLFGLLIGVPALRLTGLYLALTTFSLAVAVPQLLKYKAIENWTGGVQGLVISKPDAPFGLPLEPDQFLYLCSLAIAALTFLLVRNLLRSRTGRAMLAIRDHPLAAEAMGMHTARIKTASFAFSAAITGIAGSLGALAVEFVSPDAFGFSLSITLFVGMIVGGVASIVGAVFGGLFIVFVPNLAEGISKAAPGAIYGVILILFLYVVPTGLAGLLRRAAAKLSRKA